MNLKFKEIDRDVDKGLMFVSFDKDGEVFKWYPKWRDLTAVLEAAWVTEHWINDGKWMAYLSFVNLLLLTRFTLIDNNVDHALIIEFNKVAARIRKNMVSRLGQESEGPPSALAT